MDPLSIAAAASGLVFSVVRNGRGLAAVFEKYQDSQRCVFLIQTECTVLAAALSQLQLLFSKLPQAASSRYPPSVMEAIDLSLTGCALTMSVLSKEISGLVPNPGDSPAPILKRNKLKFLWKNDSMTELLQQLRGQSLALSLLLKALDSVSVEQILSVVQSGQATFQKVRSDAASIRQNHPDEQYAESIVDVTFDDTKTIYSLALDQDITDEEVDIVTQLESTSLSASPSTFSRASGLPRGWKIEYSTEYDEWFYIDTFAQKTQWERPASSTLASSRASGLPRGWKIGYSTEYDEWFYIDTVARKTQWERPASPKSASLRHLSAELSQQPRRKPASTPITTLPLPSSPIIKMRSAPSSSSRIPASSSNLEEDLDFAPWKLNTDPKFQTALDSLRRDSSVPVLAVGVVSEASPPKIYLSGNRKQGCATPVTRNDRFSIPNTHTFTTTVMAMLVARGVFRWEEPIADLFPSYVSKIHPFHLETTLEMLSAHHSGFITTPYNAEDGDLIRYLRRVDAKKGRSAIALSYLGRPPESSPGTSYCWNWANPVLIALAIEDRTSRSLQSLIKSIIFDPLELYSAGFGHPDAAYNSSQAGRPTQPWGHKGVSKAPLDPANVNLCQVPALNASIGIHCSMPDFASYVAMHLRGAMGLPSQALPSAGERLYHKYASTMTTVAGWNIVVREWAGGEALMDNGRCDGFSYSCWLAPVNGKAYFAVANVDGDSGWKVTDEAVALAIRCAAD